MEKRGQGLSEGGSAPLPTVADRNFSRSQDFYDFPESTGRCGLNMVFLESVKLVFLVLVPVFRKSLAGLAL